MNNRVLLNLVNTLRKYIMPGLLSNFYTTLTNLSTKYLVMCKVYTVVGGIK